MLLAVYCGWLWWCAVGGVLWAVAPLVLCFRGNIWAVPWCCDLVATTAAFFVAVFCGNILVLIAN